MTPANTPVGLPFNATGSMPARSSASHDASSSRRCCASVDTRLARRHTEELRIELVGVVEEAAGLRVRGADVVGVRVVERVEVPAAVGRELGDGVAAVEHEVPQLVRRRDTAGVAAGHADDHDRIVRSGRQCGQRVQRCRWHRTVRRAGSPRAPRPSGSRRSACWAGATRWRRSAGCAGRPRSASRTRGPGTPSPGPPRRRRRGRARRRPRSRTRSSSAVQSRFSGEPGQPLHEAGVRVGRCARGSRADQTAQQRPDLAVRRATSSGQGATAAAPRPRHRSPRRTARAPARPTAAACRSGPCVRRRPRTAMPVWFQAPHASDTAGQGSGATVFSERVEERVAGRVVRLPRAHRTCRRRWRR